MKFLGSFFGTCFWKKIASTLRKIFFFPQNFHFSQFLKNPKNPKNKFYFAKWPKTDGNCGQDFRGWKRWFLTVFLKTSYKMHTFSRFLCFWKIKNFRKPSEIPMILKKIWILKNEKNTKKKCKNGNMLQKLKTFRAWLGGECYRTPQTEKKKILDKNQAKSRGSSF